MTSVSPVSVSLSRGSRVLADPTCQSLSHTSGSQFNRFLAVFEKNYILSFPDANGVIPILLGSCDNLVFIKNMKHAMFLQK